MVKIIFFVGSFRQGGFERRISEFLEWIDQREVETDFSVICQSAHGIYKPNIPKDKIIHWPFHLFQKFYLFKLEKVLTYWLLKRSIRLGEKVVLFIGHQGIFQHIMLNEFIKADKSINVVFSLVNNLEFSPYKNSIFENLTYCRAVICNSYENRVFLSGRFHGDKVYYVPNYYKSGGNKFVNFPTNNISARLCKIVSCGSLSDQKGFEYLIGAVYLLSLRGFQLSLTIFGSGPRKNILYSIANKKGVVNFEIIEGKDFKSNVVDYDIFVCSSRFEGYPNALLEAQVMGLPAVSVDCQFGPSEIIADGHSGILVRECDSTCLAQGLEDVITKYDYFSANMRDHSNLLLEKHSERNSIRKLFDILQSL